MIVNTNGTGASSTEQTPVESNVNLGNLLGGNNQGVQVPLTMTPTPETVPPTTIPVTPVDPSTPPTGVVPPIEGTVPPTSPEVIPVETYADYLLAFNNPNSPQEILAVKNDLLSLFKADNIDATGNLVDSTGKVLLSADKIKLYVEEDKLPLDINGNIVNDLGVIIKSNQELIEENSIIHPVANALSTNFGIKLEGIELEDTIEGIVNVVQAATKQLNINTIKNFLDSMPEVKNFVNHLALGGTSDNFTNSNINYKAIDIKTLDEGSKVDLLRRSFKEQGNANGDMLVDLIKKSGEEEFNKAVAGSIAYLDNKQNQNNKELEARVKTAQLEEEERTNTYWNNVQQVITKGQINNIKVPVNEREAFFDFISKPINDKMESAESIAMQKESIEFDLAVSYLRFKGGDISKLAANIAKETRVETLRERLNRQKSISGNGVPITTHSQVGSSTLDIGTLLGGQK